MSLIFKRGNDDDRSISSYRAISLTNIDYRLLSFTLYECMQRVISRIVSNDQTAYIKGRYTVINIRLVSDVIEYYDSTKKSGILLMLDFQKAFDTIEGDFYLRI